MLDDVSAAFGDRPHVADNTAEQAIAFLRDMFLPPLPDEVSRGLLHRSADGILRAADRVHGGFGGAPKFPQSPVIDFLLAYHTLTGDERSLEVATADDSGDVRGGIFDQVGGGIARYTVDDSWLVPHFEKMLYDNGQLLSTLARVQAASPERRVGARHAHDRRLPRPRSRDAGRHATCHRSRRTPQARKAPPTSGPTRNSPRCSRRPNSPLAEKELGVTRDGNWEGRTIITRPEWSRE